jgi:hypothetical protein
MLHRLWWFSFPRRRQSAVVLSVTSASKVSLRGSGAAWREACQSQRAKMDV